ncbi:ABC transporter ATP-binding protein [Erysipelothrix urinaevulpis]|uniref:ABC transporter ATP-binding protein n=1 Tax=Erysipelothrix urinaevulpis TaxID=2683717 RepID=UPI0013590B69|nr:ABC transporter ATP-binding protein [Erysipelothrix urinaevulpis]
MIEFKNVSKSYVKGKKAVDSMNLTIDKGEFVCFIGTSGSGKTTSMRMINRMESPSEGQILINDVDINEIDAVQLRRKIGYVIQQIGLMPHMTIYENIVMVPKLLKWPEEKMRETAKDLMKRINLSEDYLDAYPDELSGGMQQRVGVIRALAADQEIVLMDEPFGALDPITRESLQHLIKRLQKEMNKTIVFVTHDMDEALTLADKIVVMSEGKVIQEGTPKDILTNAANEFVEELIGEDRLSQAGFEFETVEKIMLKNPIKINENEPITNLAKLMRETKVDDILVVDDENNLKGRVDLYTLSVNRGKYQYVHEIMKKVTYVVNTTSIRDGIYYIHDLGYRNLTVVDDDGKLKGMVTRGSIVSEVYDVFWKEYEPQEEFDASFETDEIVQAASDVVQNGDSKEQA